MIPLKKTRVGGWCCLDLSQKPGSGALCWPCSLSKTRVGGLCCHVRSQKPGSGVFVALFSLKNPGRGFYVDLCALKNPGRGFVLPCSRSKARVEGFCYHVRSQKLSVFSLKNSDRGPCGRSQKPWSGFGVDRVHSQKPGSGVFATLLALKNPGGFCADRVCSQKPGSGVCVRSQKPLVRARVDRVSSQKPW